jgi:hypothetical protein
MDAAPLLVENGRQLRESGLEILEKAHAEATAAKSRAQGPQGRE